MTMVSNGTVSTSASTSYRPTKEQLEQAKAAANAMAKRKLNQNSPELQEILEDYVSKFIENDTYINPATGARYDFPREGMLAEIVARTPVRVYDLPELKERCATAFVDTTGRMYFADTFLRELIKEQEAGKDSLFFLFKHEAEHLRRIHLQRMLDFPPKIANSGQDTRINIDIVKTTVADRLAAQGKQNCSDVVFHRSLQDYYNDMGPMIQGGTGTKYTDYVKYGEMSEEAITAELYKEWTEPPKDPTKEISFIDLCEGVAQDLDAMSKASSDPARQQSHSALAIETRRIGKAKGKVKLNDLENACAALAAVAQSTDITARDMHHNAMQPTAGAKVKSVNTGDDYIDTLQPSERNRHLRSIIDQILNPAADGPEMAPSGGIKVKDLEQGRAGKSKNGGKPQGQSTSTPGGVYDGDDHVLTAEELADILNKAGLKDVADKLGYNDLEKMDAEKAAAKAAVVSSVNKATEDKMRVGSRYPGAHLVDYAVAQMNDFYRPVLNLRTAVKQLVAEAGRGFRYDHDEPWMVFHADPSDIGVDSINDVPYMGSFIPGRHDKPLIIFLIDTSGSVNDNMLKRFVSEAVNAARENESGDTSPDVLIVFADTVCRGEPVFITTENYQEFLSNGINYGGRGGTNFTASVQNVFHMLKPGGALEGRKLDAMCYLTDTFDAPPDQQAIEETAVDVGLSRWPTMLFLAPKECYNEAFKVGVAPYADTIFFDKQELEIDLEEVESNISSRGLRSDLSPA